MIPVGQPYRPAGTYDAKSILITTILGTTAAVIGAALFWLWEWSPIPTLVLFTSVFQGLGVGAVMAFAIGRLRMSNTRIVAVVGFACGLLSIVLVHYGHYLHLVTTTTSEWRTAIAQDRSMPEGLRQSFLTQIDTDPAAFIDPMLVRKTHHSGFIGSLFLRNQRGRMVKIVPEQIRVHAMKGFMGDQRGRMVRSWVLSGVFLWIRWGVEALTVAGIASLFAWERAAAPFCEECGYWCVKQPDLFFLPAASAAALVEAVRNDNASRIAALRSTRFVDSGSGLVSATLRACPGCDQSFADISQRVVKGKETEVKTLLNQHRVSPEVVDAIRNAPVPAEVLKEDIPDEDESTMPEESEGGSRYPSI